MESLYGPVTALAVAAIYYIWRGYFQLTLQRERTLRRRVAYMLWVMANGDPLWSSEADADYRLLDLMHDVSVNG